MKEGKVTQEEALEIRKALWLPGGFELHIGVCRTTAAVMQCSKSGQLLQIQQNCSTLKR